MLTILLVYCLGSSCITRTPVADTFQLPQACLIAAEQAAAAEDERLAVAHEHPGYVLARIGCVRAGLRGA